MAWTRTGTISLTNGQVKVYGSGTPWVANGKTRPGDALLAPDGKVYEIGSIESNTELTLADAYLGATASGQAYKIQHLGLLPAELAVGISDLQSKYLTTIAQLYEWETSEAATVPITNPATGATVNVKPLKRFLSALGDGSMAGSFTNLVASGSVAVGVPLSDWAEFHVMEQPGGSVFSNATQIGTVQNAVYDGVAWKYKGDGPAAFCQLAGGVFSVYVAPAGTAGSAVSWSQVLGVSQAGQAVLGNSAVGSQLVFSGKTGISNQSYLTSTLGDRLSFLYNGIECISILNAAAVSMGRTYLVPGSASFLTVVADGTSKYGITVANKIETNTNFMSFVNSSDAIIGSIAQSGSSTAYVTTSDHRLKENVRPADALSFMDIEFVDFEWIDGRHDCGVIAHRLQSVYPDLVIGEKDATEEVTVEVSPAVLDDDGNVVTPAVTEQRIVPKYQQVNYIGLIGRMGTKVQQHERRIEELEAKLEAALARIDALEDLLPS